MTTTALLTCLIKYFDLTHRQKIFDMVLFDWRTGMRMDRRVHVDLQLYRLWMYQNYCCPLGGGC
jgi:hypothetical protein